MDKRNFAFSRINYLLLAVGMIIVIAGLTLMGGSGSTAENFDPEIFSPRRIKLAPVVSLLGYLFIIVAIVYRKGEKNEIEG